MRAKVTDASKRHPSLSIPRGISRWLTVTLLLAITLGGVMPAAGQTGRMTSASGRIGAAGVPANAAAPSSLKTIPVPWPDNLDMFVKSRPQAVALGKALFWDMQVGSDGVQACASCHFNAGADNRATNAVNPGQLRVTPGTTTPEPDWTFQAVGPNGTLTPDKFPFTKFRDPADRTTEMTRDWNDVVSSPGVYNTRYDGITATGAVELGIAEPDPVFNTAGLNTRRVPPRNAPTVINAVFNFANFHDGRANNIFNGSSPWGDADPNAGVWWTDIDGVLRKHRVRIPYAALASQAVGPPGNSTEMSFAGRDFPEIARKLLNPHIAPLGQQNVHPKDSVLGSYANSTLDSAGRAVLARGLKTTYEQMVKAAFHDQYWNSSQTVTTTAGSRQYSQMEANFSLFFGLAIQVYEATLVSNDSPYDRFQAGDVNAMSASAQQGLNIFLSANDAGETGGSCIACHGTSTFSNASVMHVGTTNFGASFPEGLAERMIVGNRNGAWYDSGYYNIGVSPSDEDLGRGAKDPFGNPLSHVERTLVVANGGQLSFDPFASSPPGVLPLPCGPTDPFGRGCPGDQRVATKGSFKVPTLRNVELTGPYMHNGGQATLAQVIDFYARGGNFFDRNINDVDIDIEPLFGLNQNRVLNPGGLPNAVSRDVVEANHGKLVSFLLALTDDRVRWEQAPFDHPELFIPNGAEVKEGQLSDIMLRLPAIGADGRAAEGQPPLGTFLGLDPNADPSAPRFPGFFWSVEIPLTSKNGVPAPQAVPASASTSSRRRRAARSSH